MTSSVIWYGWSGAAYSLEVHGLDDELDDRGGVYIFARPDAAGPGWKAICIGEAESFARELPAHPKRQCARNHAATHVHVLPQADQQRRHAAVRDLIARWHPACNQTLTDAIHSYEHVGADG
jgi:hypothetical protein